MVKRGLFAVAAMFLALPAANAGQGMVTLESRHDVDATAERLLGALDEAGMNVFGDVPHSDGAADAGMELPPTRLIMFGNPEIGTVLMQCDRSVGIDLPMKALIWEDGGTTYIGYNGADYLAERHGLAGCEEPLQQIEQALGNFASQAAGKE